MNQNVNPTRQKHSFEVLLNSSNLTKMPSSAVGDVVPSKLQLAPLVLLDLNHRTRNRTRPRRKPGRRAHQLLRLGHHPNPAAGDYSHYQPLDDVDACPGERPATKVHATPVLLNGDRGSNCQDAEAVFQEKCQVRFIQGICITG